MDDPHSAHCVKWRRPPHPDSTHPGEPAPAWGSRRAPATRTSHTGRVHPDVGEFGCAPHPEFAHPAESAPTWGARARSAPQLHTPGRDHPDVGSPGALGTLTSHTPSNREESGCAPQPDFTHPAETTPTWGARARSAPSLHTRPATMGNSGELRTPTSHTRPRPPRRGEPRRAPHPNFTHPAKTTPTWGARARSAPSLHTRPATVRNPGALRTPTSHTRPRPPRRGEPRRAPHPDFTHPAKTTPTWGAQARSALPLHTRPATVRNPGALRTPTSHTRPRPPRRGEPGRAPHPHFTQAQQPWGIRVRSALPLHTPG